MLTARARPIGHLDASRLRRGIRTAPVATGAAHLAFAVVEFVLLERLLDRVRGLAFAFDVVGVVFLRIIT